MSDNYNVFGLSDQSGIQNPATEDIDMQGFQITGLAPGVDSTDAATIGQISGGGGSDFPAQFNLNMNGFTLYNNGIATAPTDLYQKQQVDTIIANLPSTTIPTLDQIPLAVSVVDVNNNVISNLADPIGIFDATNKQWTLSQIAAIPGADSTKIESINLKSKIQCNEEGTISKNLNSALVETQSLVGNKQQKKLGILNQAVVSQASEFSTIIQTGEELVTTDYTNQHSLGWSQNDASTNKYTGIFTDVFAQPSTFSSSIINGNCTEFQLQHNSQSHVILADNQVKLNKDILLQDNRIYVNDGASAYIQQNAALNGISLFNNIPEQVLRIDDTQCKIFKPLSMSSQPIHDCQNPSLDQDVATRIWTLAQIPAGTDTSQIISTDSFSRLKCQDIGFLSKRLAGIELEDEKLINGVTQTKQLKIVDHQLSTIAAATSQQLYQNNTIPLTTLNRLNTERWEIDDKYLEIQLDYKNTGVSDSIIRFGSDDLIFQRHVTNQFMKFDGINDLIQTNKDIILDGSGKSIYFGSINNGYLKNNSGNIGIYSQNGVQVAQFDNNQITMKNNNGIQLPGDSYLEWNTNNFIIKPDPVLANTMLFEYQSSGEGRFLQFNGGILANRYTEAHLPLYIANTVTIDQPQQVTTKQFCDDTYALQGSGISLPIEISDVNLLQTSLDSKAPLLHTHIIDDVSNLQASLDSKAPLIHTHIPSDIIGFDTQVRTSRLDQMTDPDPTTKILQYSSNPVITLDNQIPNKKYVDDTVVAGPAILQPMNYAQFYSDWSYQNLGAQTPFNLSQWTLQDQSAAFTTNYISLSATDTFTVIQPGLYRVWVHFSNDQLNCELYGSFENTTQTFQLGVQGSGRTRPDIWSVAYCQTTSEANPANQSTSSCNFVEYLNADTYHLYMGTGRNLGNTGNARMFWIRFENIDTAQISYSETALIKNINSTSSVVCGDAAQNITFRAQNAEPYLEMVANQSYFYKPCTYWPTEPTFNDPLQIVCKNYVDSRNLSQFQAADNLIAYSQPFNLVQDTNIVHKFYVDQQLGLQKSSIVSDSSEIVARVRDAPRAFEIISLNGLDSQKKVTCNFTTDEFLSTFDQQTHRGSSHYFQDQTATQLVRIAQHVGPNTGQLCDFSVRNDIDCRTVYEGAPSRRSYKRLVKPIEQIILPQLYAYQYKEHMNMPGDFHGWMIDDLPEDYVKNHVYSDESGLEHLEKNHLRDHIINSLVLTVKKQQQRIDTLLEMFVNLQNKVENITK